MLGLVALPRTRPGRLRGRGLAVAGLVLGGLGTLAWGMALTLVVGTALASRPLPADVTAPVEARAVQLVTGNCVAELPPDGEVDRARVVPCEDAHVAQVLTSYRFVTGTHWPGDAEVIATTSATCDLTAAERERGLRLVAWAPTERSWAHGDRTGLCLAVAEAPFTGSLLDGSADR